MGGTGSVGPLQSSFKFFHSAIFEMRTMVVITLYRPRTRQLRAYFIPKRHKIFERLFCSSAFACSLLQNWS
jgi:hypothetical protein